MSKKILCVILFGLGFLPANAQQIVSGPIWRQAAGYLPVEIAGITKNTIWLVNAAGERNDGIIRDLLLEKIDMEDLTLKESFSFPGLFAERQRFYPEGVRVWNDSVRIWGSAYDKEKRQNCLLMRNIDEKGNIGVPLEMLRLPANGYVYNKRRFGIAYSKSEKLMVTWGISQSDDSLHIGFRVFDEHLQERKHFFLSQRSHVKVKAEQALVDDLGNFHLLLSHNTDKPQQGRTYRLYAFPVMSDETLEYLIELPERRIGSLGIQMADDDFLIAAGYFQEIFREGTSPDGFFFLRINRETGEIVLKEMRQMGQEFLNLYSGNQSRPERKELEHLQLKQIIPLNDGACLLLAEQVWKEERCETDVRSGLVLCDTHYVAGNAWIQHMSSTGSLDWVQILRKVQRSIGDEGVYSGCLTQLNKQTISLYFNQALRQGKESATAAIEQGNSVLSFFRIDGSGQDEYGTYPKAESFTMIPSSAFQTPGEVYFLGVKGAMRRLFKSSN